MIINKVYIGTWFQRTDLHLRELYDFFSKGKAAKGLDEEKLIQLKKGFGKFSIEFREDVINYLILKTEKGITIEVTEDGIVLLSTDYNEARSDVKVLKDFYEKTLSPAVNYLFSLGAPLPKELANIELVFPFFFVATDVIKDDAKRLLTTLKDSVITEVEGERITLYVGSIGNVLAFKNSNEVDKAKELIRYGVFFREFESQLSRYLNLHRQIWEEMDKMRAQKSIKRAQFPKLRNNLLARKKFIAFVSARLSQMDHLMAEREKYVEDQKLRDELQQISWDSFASLIAAHQYVIDLWRMTDEYVDSTIRLLEIFYQENTQRELYALEIISLFNVVIGLVNFFKSISPYDLVIVVVSFVIFLVTLRYLIRGRSFTLPPN